MNGSVKAKITVSQPLSDQAVRRALEPIGRQRHDENSGCANNAADDHHSIRRDPLSKRADNRREHNDNNGVDPDQFADRRVQSHLAVSKLWKDIVRQQENHFQKTDEEEEHEQAVKSRLPDQATEKRDAIVRAFLHALRDASPNAG